jgi:D-mannonate dehydratase
MEKTWRWFGKNDVITLSDLKQIGAEGIITAVHHIPNGDIFDSKQYIKDASSLSSGIHNDAPDLARTFASRTMYAVFTHNENMICE